MTGADIGVGWVDNSGQLHFQVNLHTIYLITLLIFLDRIDMQQEMVDH